MIWDDLIAPVNSVIHNVQDLFYAVEYIFSNLSAVLLIIFTPLQFALNFIKGFFDGITTTAPATAITWVFPDNVMAVFNAIPYFSLFEWVLGAMISVFFLVFITNQLLKL
jgi:hypothetical protein